jgi:hypothetical protein
MPPRSLDVAVAVAESLPLCVACDPPWDCLVAADEGHLVILPRCVSCLHAKIFLRKWELEREWSYRLACLVVTATWSISTESSAKRLILEEQSIWFFKGKRRLQLRIDRVPAKMVFDNAAMGKRRNAWVTSYDWENFPSSPCSSGPWDDPTAQ